jgi:hypothetical protein
MITTRLFYVQQVWPLTNAELSQAERIKSLDNKVRFLEEEKQLMKLLLSQQRPEPGAIPEQKQKRPDLGVIPEEKQKSPEPEEKQKSPERGPRKQVNCGT